MITYDICFSPNTIIVSHQGGTGRQVKKMNWFNYDLFMKIYAICDAKNAILKYFVLDMWKKLESFFYYKRLPENHKFLLLLPK